MLHSFYLYISCLCAICCCVALPCSKGSRAVPTCPDHSTPENFSCCSNETIPCYSFHEKAGGAQSAFHYDSKLHTMVPKACKSCCSAAPWPQGFNYGYPWRMYPPEEKYKAPTDTVPHDSLFNPHEVIGLYPYGGGTYALSKGMMNAIGRDMFEQYVYGLQCYNADINVMSVVFNAGYSLTVSRKILSSAVHHIKEIH